MPTLILVLGSTVAISVIARISGSSRKLAVLLAMIPITTQGLLFSTTMVIVRDPSGARIPKWLLVAQSTVLPLILAVIAAALIKRKEPNQAPEATPGQRPS